MIRMPEAVNQVMNPRRAGWTLKVVDRDRQNDDLRVYWRSRPPRSAWRRSSTFACCTSNCSERSMDSTHPDFEDLCKCLNAHGVEYLIVGAHALARYWLPRFTGDFDVFVGPSSRQRCRGCSAQSRSSGRQWRRHHHPSRWSASRKILQMGLEPWQIHIMTDISGVTWAEAWAGGGRPNRFRIDLSVLHRARRVRPKQARLRPFEGSRRPGGSRGDGSRGALVSEIGADGCRRRGRRLVQRPPSPSPSPPHRPGTPPIRRPGARRSRDRHHVERHARGGRGREPRRSDPSW